MCWIGHRVDPRHSEVINISFTEASGIRYQVQKKVNCTLSKNCRYLVFTTEGGVSTTHSCLPPLFSALLCFLYQPHPNRKRNRQIKQHQTT